MSRETNHMVDQVECKRIGCAHFLECVIPHPPDRTKPIEQRGTFFPSVRLDWSGAWFVACDHYENNGEVEGDERQLAVGEMDHCKSCNHPIVWAGSYWKHDGDFSPRHPAAPTLASKRLEKQR